MAPKKPKPPFYAGFDLGGTKMLSAVYDSRFRQLGRSRTSTNGQQGAERVIQRMLSTLADALAKAGLDSSDLAAVGIGVPGPVNMTKGVVHTSLNLGWQDVPLVKILQQQLDRPLWLLNDVDAGVFGEFEHGAARGAHCVPVLAAGLSMMDRSSAAVVNRRWKSGTSRLSTEDRFVPAAAMVAWRRWPVGWLYHHKLLPWPTVAKPLTSTNRSVQRSP